MTRDDVIRMAALAGFEVVTVIDKEVVGQYGDSLTDEVTRLIAIVAAECAQACKDQYVDAIGTGCTEDFAYNNACDHCADAILERFGVKP